MRTSTTPVSVSSASQIAVSSMRLCVVPCALPEISRTVPACSISAAQPPRPCIPFALQLPSVQTTVLSAPGERHVSREGPVEILERRFAEGEITAEDYRARREVLVSGPAEPETAPQAEGRQ